MNSSPNTTKPNVIKRLIKRSLQHVAAVFGRHNRSHQQPQLLILMYHRILHEDDKAALSEEPGMTVSPETFKQHIALLKQYFDIIKLSDWAQLKIDGKKLPEKACAITFDDGWADNYDSAFPILKEANVPATIFLVSDMIGTNDVFWPERLTRLITTIASKYPQHWSHPELLWLQSAPNTYRFSATLPTREEFSALIACAKDLSDEEIHQRITHIEDVLQLETEDHPPSLLDWQQISEMTESGIVEIGSHTCSHVRLNEKISDELLKKEIINSKLNIEKNTGQTVKTFCFPNGDFCPQALELVQQHYDAAVSTQSGWNTVQSEQHLLQRIGIHQDISYDKTSFLARLSGWM